MAFLLLMLFYFRLVAASNDFFGPTDPTGLVDFSVPTACACPGSPVQYYCTVNDPTGTSTTRWRGSALNCTGGQASLFHDQYTSGNAADACNDGAFDVNAQGLTNVTDNCYTSVLTVNVVRGLNGKTVECTNAGASTIGSSTITIAAPLRQPTSPAIFIKDQTFTITWTPPTAECGNTVTYMYPGLAGSTCGQCTGSSDTPSVTCSGWTAQGQSCSFVARADVCGGGQQGEESEPVFVTLQELSVVPITSGTVIVDQSQQKYSLSIAWTDTDTRDSSIAESGGQVLVNGQVTYSLDFGDGSHIEISCSDSTCSSPTITREIVNGRIDLAVSLAAINALGTGPFQEASCELTNTFVDVRRSQSNIILTCAAESCAIRYGSDESFQNLPFAAASGQPFQPPDTSNVYYFEASNNCGVFTIRTQGTFQTASSLCDASNTATVGSVVGVVSVAVALLAGIPLGVLIMYCVVRKKLQAKAQQRPPSPLYETMGTGIDIKGNAAYGPFKRV